MKQKYRENSVRLYLGQELKRLKAYAESIYGVGNHRLSMLAKELIKEGLDKRESNIEVLAKSIEFEGETRAKLLGYNNLKEWLGKKEVNDDK